jgi:hypothetical protein
VQVTPDEAAGQPSVDHGGTMQVRLYPGHVKDLQQRTVIGRQLMVKTVMDLPG